MAAPTKILTITLAFCLAVIAPPTARGATEVDVAEMRRMLSELQAQNRELARRLATLEAERPAARAAEARGAEARVTAPRASPPAPRTTAAAAPAPAPPLTPGITPAAPRLSDIEQRIRELELARTAQEDGTRWIIQDAMSKLGPKINELLELSGSIEVMGSRVREFSGPVKESLSINTIELDFGIKLNDWISGSLVLAYDSGSGIQFQSTDGFATGVDRLTVDRAVVTIGDVQRFPLFLRVGRDVLPFGSSTGVHRADVLSITNPLTIDVFETRKTSVGIGFAWPTPEPGPSPRPVIVPVAQPRVIGPFVGRAAQWMGYRPPPHRPTRPVPVAPAPRGPPFYGSVHIYEGTPELATNRRASQNYNISLGYRTEGHCGRPYEALRDSLVCPWAFDFHVDYNPSLFDSAFLENGYRAFLGQIGMVPGVSATTKINFGPFALVGEVNTAIRRASFVDGLGNTMRIAPMAWQVSLGYQFDWNPWLDAVGGQGTFVAVGYSGTRDLAGATVLISGQPKRTGAVPQSRFFITAGEWVTDGVKLQLEYALNFDYSRSQGGTGKMGHGIFSVLTVNF